MNDENRRKENLEKMKKYWKDNFIANKSIAFKAMEKWWFETANVKGYTKDQLLSHQHLQAIQQMTKEPEIEELKKFLLETRGARGRLMKIFGDSNLANILQKHKEVGQLLEIGKHI